MVYTKENFQFHESTLFEDFFMNMHHMHIYILSKNHPQNRNGYKEINLKNDKRIIIITYI